MGTSAVTVSPPTQCERCGAGIRQQSRAYAALVAPLIEAVKELEAANENNAAIITALREELRELRASRVVRTPRRRREDVRQYPRGPCALRRGRPAIGTTGISSHSKGVRSDD